MKKLKSERHHWWPECVSKHWAGDDGKVGWLKPDGSCIRLPPATLGVIGNGHHIKMGNGAESTPWDHSFERTFDKADSSFPSLVSWLEGLERRPMRDVKELKQRHMPQQADDDMLKLMTECAVSLAVRGPRNREACVSLAVQLRGSIPSAERNSLIGMNMRNSQRVLSDSIGSRAKFVAIYSEKKEFVFGDGFFHNVTIVQMAPSRPKMLVPITPNISIVVFRPGMFTLEPKLTTLVLEEEEVDRCNHAVQVYSRNAIYYRSQMPEQVDDAFRCATHQIYADPNNPVDSLLNSIPGVYHRRSFLDPRLSQPVVPEFQR